MTFFDEPPFGLTPEQVAAREGKLTASRVGILMNGTAEAQTDLWREMIGDKEPDDLSDAFPVQLGSWTEELNLNWIEREMGVEITRRGESIVDGWMSCTLDGIATPPGCPVDAKHVNSFGKIEDAAHKYRAQMHWQMSLTGTKTSWLSVIRGNFAPEVVVVDWDQEYWVELYERALAFMACVNDLTPPHIFEPVVPPVAGKVVSMEGNNAWSDAAARWVKKKADAADFEKAAKQLKEATPDDATKAIGHGIEVNRAKNGSLRIKEI
jgi:hypothetical protein